MKSSWLALKAAFRALAWKSTAMPGANAIQSNAVELGVLVALCTVLIGVWLGIEYWRAGAEFRFDIYGFNALIAWLAVCLVLAAFFVKPGGRLRFVSALVAISIAMEIAGEVYSHFLLTYLPDFAAASWWRGMALWWIGFFAFAIWWIGATAKIISSLEPERAPARRRAAALWLAQLAALLLLPHSPVFKGRDFNRTFANTWEAAHAYLDRRDDRANPASGTAPEELAQPMLLEAAITQLVPQRPDATDVYAIGIAGWSEEDVFIKELGSGLTAIGQSLPIDGRAMRLVNHRDTVKYWPFASRQNFAAAVRAIGRVMDKDEDVLLLLVTSHGSPGGVGLMLAGTVYGTLTPDDVAAVLDQEGIKNRIVIVSACYAGVFLKPLANDNTIVLTAADENNPSFGCSNEREWTYFGDALFNRSLKPGTDLKRAFENARALIAEWESNEGKLSSNPQGHFGEALLTRLAPVYIASDIVEDHAPPKRRAAVQD